MKNLKVIKEELSNYVIYNIYPYGSTVYKCNTRNSDYDYIIIVQGDSIKQQLKFNNIDLNIYSVDVFKSKIRNHDIDTLECLFLEKPIIENYKFDFNLDLSKLRHSISKLASNSFVKAKKKIEKEKDYYIGKKSLFHSLRIILFGIQIAKYNKIVNYEEANYLYNDIVNNNITEWLYFKEKYQSIFNSFKSKFKSLTHK